MPYVWPWLRIAQLLLLLPNRWKVSLHCREGSILSAHANACVMCVFRFCRVFHTMFTAEVYSCYHTVNDSSSITNHGIAATLAYYVNRELTNTLVFLVSPRGPYGREEEHAIHYYSGGFGQPISRNFFRAGPDVASGIKCKYNCARILRPYLAPEFRTNPPAPNHSSGRPPAT